MILLPNGEDPDGFLSKGNLRDFDRRVAGAVPLIDFFFEWLMKTHDVKSIDGKVKAAEEGMDLIGKIPDRIRRDLYVKALGERLDIQGSVLYETLKSSSKSRPRAEEDLKKRFAEERVPKSEELVVRLMVHHPELIPIISGEGILREFESPILQKMAEKLEDLFQKKGRLDLTEALGCLEEDLKGKLCEFALQERGLEGEHREKILKDCIQKIREERIKKEKGELQKRIKEADKQREDKGLNPLLKQKLELARKRERGLQKDGIRKG